MQVRFYHAELPFHYPFTISGGRTKSVQEALIVSLTLNGVTGFGEAPAIKYYQISVPDLIQKGVSAKSEIEAFSELNPYAFNEQLEKLFPDDTFLRCALDLAFWDLISRLKNTSPAAILGLPLPEKIACDYTIGIDTPGEMLRKMEALPWPVYKIKVGFNRDAELLNTLCENSDALFRLDANAAWNLNEAVQFLQGINHSRIQLIEQALKRDCIHEMEILRRHTHIPFVADEDFREISDLDACTGRFNGINIKLTKCGGISPAIKIIEEARRKGLKIMLGTMNESSIGTWALLQLASEADFVDADGPLLLNGDYATGLSYKGGYVHIPPKAEELVVNQTMFEEIW
jgi:L-alanine-DL-glutamate epimerase-like enolase superfamily enzyme